MNFFQRIFDAFKPAEKIIQQGEDVFSLITGATDEFVSSIRFAVGEVDALGDKTFSEAFHFFFVPPQASFDLAHTDWPTWLQWLAWNTRNPLPGLNDALGCKNQGPVASSGLTVDYQHPNGQMWNPAGQGFNQLSHQVLKTGKIYHFISFRGKGIEWYFGTRPTLSFGVALRRSNAPGY